MLTVIKNALDSGFDKYFNGMSIEEAREQGFITEKEFKEYTEFGAVGVLVPNETVDKYFYLNRNEYEYYRKKLYVDKEGNVFFKYKKLIITGEAGFKHVYPDDDYSKKYVTVGYFERCIAEDAYEVMNSAFSKAVEGLQEALGQWKDVSFYSLDKKEETKELKTLIKKCLSAIENYREYFKYDD